VTNPGNRIALADAERELGRPCPHDRFGRDDYCKRCANSLAQYRRDLAGRGSGVATPKRTLAQIEAELGRLCDHTVGPMGRNQRGDYCRVCSNIASVRRYKARHPERKRRRGAIQSQV
jgi:hypothetical protein